MRATPDEPAAYLFPDAYLREFTTRVFMHFGVPESDAEQAADVLARSDLRGIDSHGIARLHTYFEMLELGRINPRPKIKIVRERASVASVDGVTEEFVLRNVKKEAPVAQSSGERRYRSAEQRSGGGAPTWAPWAQPYGGAYAPPDRGYRQAAPKKPKTLFELMFGN